MLFSIPHTFRLSSEGFLLKKICIRPMVWTRHFCPDFFPKSSWANTHKSWSGPLWCGHQESSLPSSITSLKRVNIVERRNFTLQKSIPGTPSCKDFCSAVGSSPWPVTKSMNSNSKVRFLPHAGGSMLNC